MLSIQAVRGLRRLRASGIVPCIISFSRQLPCFLTVWPYSMLASLLWRCLTVPSLLQLCYEPTLLFSSLSTKPAESFAVGIGSIFGQRDCIHGAYSKDTEKASYYFGLDRAFFPPYISSLSPLHTADDAPTQRDRLRLSRLCDLSLSCHLTSFPKKYHCLSDFSL